MLRHTSSLVPSLKTKKQKTLGTCLFQSRLGRASFNRRKKKTITFCLCCLFVRLFLKTCINELHTGLKSRSWCWSWGRGREGGGSEGRLSDVDFSAQHQHWEPLPTPSSALLSTCKVSEIGCSPYFLIIIFFTYVFILLFSEGNWSLS